MKKALRETQTLRAGCSERSQKIRPAADPLTRWRGTAKIRRINTTYNEKYIRVLTRW